MALGPLPSGSRRSACELRVSAECPLPEPLQDDEHANQWSAWRRADDQREGAFGWWSEVQGAPREAPAAGTFPCELRCELVYTAIPGVVQ